MKTLPLAGALAFAMGAGIILVESKAMTAQIAGTATRLPVEGQFPPLDGAIGFQLHLTKTGVCGRRPSTRP